MREVMNRKEAAKIAGVSPRTILRAIHDRQLEAVKIGEGKTCSYIISPVAITEYIQSRGKK